MMLANTYIVLIFQVLLCFTYINYFNYFGMNNIPSPSSHEAYNLLEKQT